LVFVADSVWWLVAGGCLKEVSSMKQKIHALTSRIKKKVGKGHHSFSMRSLERKYDYLKMMKGKSLKNEMDSE
jgi:hypothetical protein